MAEKFDFVDNNLFEKKLIFNLIYDNRFLDEIIEIIEPKYFNKAHHRWIVDCIKNHYNENGRPVDKNVFVVDLKSDTQIDDKSPLFINIVNFLKRVNDEEYMEKMLYNNEKVQEATQQFCSTKRWVEAITKGADWVGTDRENEIPSLMNKVEMDVNPIHIGTDFTDMKSRKEQKARENVISTPWKAINNYIKGVGKNELACWVAGMGTGKCFGKGTEILMYDGSIKKVEDIEEGDQVMGDDSTPRHVLSLARGKEQMYEINPIKGDSWMCNESHILTMVESGTSEKNGSDKVHHMTVKDYLKLSNKRKSNMKLFRKGVRFFSNNELLDLDPYFLGLWLGDGHQDSPRITTKDQEVINWCDGYCESLEDISLKEYNTESKSVSIISLTAEEGINTNDKSYTSIRSLLDNNNLLWNKHVPKKYLTSSVENRFKLLAGLLDSDGGLEKGYFSYSSSIKKLADDVAFLARSLGFTAVVNKRNLSQKNENYKDSYRITISGDIYKIPTKIKRKKRYKPRKQKKDHLRIGFEVIKKGVDNYYGFKVDKNNLFLLSDFTVVHNSTHASNIALHAFKEGYNVVIYSLELGEGYNRQRIDTIMMGVEADKLPNNYDKMEHILDDYKQNGGSLTIKKFGSGITTNTIKNHFNRLRARGKDPDLFIIDYLDLMDSINPYHNRKKDWEKFGEITKEIRNEICFKEQVAGHAFVQGNTTAIQEFVIRADSSSGGARRLFPADAVFGLARPDELKEQNKINLSFIKSRFSSDGFYLTGTTDYSIGSIEYHTNEKYSVAGDENLEVKKQISNDYKKYRRKTQASKPVKDADEFDFDDV